MSDQKFLSTREVADILGVSRVTVFNKIKAGEIEARKVGRNYVVPKEQFNGILTTKLTDSSKLQIHKTIEKAVDEYGEALRMLGKE